MSYRTYKESELQLSKWEIRFLALADHVSNWGKDPSTRVGAVVADGKRLLSVGFNGAPPEIDDAYALRDRETKLACTIHAEMNAMDFAGRESLEGCTLYITHPPCTQCAPHIAKKRVGEVVFRDLDPEMRKRWNCDKAEETLLMGGVKVTRIG